MCYPFLVMMFLEWFCLKDQARYLCICELFVSKDFAYYFISFRLFNQIKVFFFIFQPLDYTVLSFLLNKKSWFTLYVSAVVSNVLYDFILSFEFEINSWICKTLCSSVVPHAVVECKLLKLEQRDIRSPMTPRERCSADLITLHLVCVGVRVQTHIGTRQRLFLGVAVVLYLQLPYNGLL